MVKTIVLVGMMGSGKSSIGRQISKKTGLCYIDIDEEIEKKTKSKIKDIFKKKGEVYFRKIEEIICKKFINGEKKIVSIGGGAFMNKNIRAIISKVGKSFWIDVNKDILFDRLKKSKNLRPLLDYSNLKKSIDDIINQRKSTYAKADVKIKVYKTNKENIANKIIKFL